jgi:hypothetical protein
MNTEEAERASAARKMLAALIALIPCVDRDDELFTQELNDAREAVRLAKDAGVEFDAQKAVQS